jgi:hypothetical protein
MQGGFNPQQQQSGLQGIQPSQQQLQQNQQMIQQQMQQQMQQMSPEQRQYYEQDQQYQQQMDALGGDTLQKFGDQLNTFASSYGGDRNSPAFQAAMLAQDSQLRSQMGIPQDPGRMREQQALMQSQPMQGGFNPQQLQNLQQTLQQAQQAGQQYQQLGGQLAGQSIQGGQPMDAQQMQRMQQLRDTLSQQGGQQFGGQPQGGFNPQQQGGQQSLMQQRMASMPQAPTTQQMGQENPRMAAMRRMQRMRFGNR